MGRFKDLAVVSVAKRLQLLQELACLVRQVFGCEIGLFFHQFVVSLIVWLVEQSSGRGDGFAHFFRKVGGTNTSPLYGRPLTVDRGKESREDSATDFTDFRGFFISLGDDRRLSLKK